MSHAQVLDAIREGVKLAVGYTRMSSSARRTPRGPSSPSCSSASSGGRRRGDDDQRTGHRRVRDAHEFGELVRTVREALADHVVTRRTATTTSGSPSRTRGWHRERRRQVEVAVNGIGERAGNCSLEEIADDRPYARQALASVTA